MRLRSCALLETVMDGGRPLLPQDRSVVPGRVDLFGTSETADAHGPARSAAESTHILTKVVLGGHALVRIVNALRSSMIVALAHVLLTHHLDGWDRGV